VFLEIKDLCKNFGGLAAVSDFSMTVEKGHMASLIGPNGAGKTTIFNLITGVIRPTSGKINYQDKDITGKPPHAVARHGIGRTFQITAMFPDFTVLQNIIASYYLHSQAGFWNTFFNTPKYKRNEAEALERSQEILEIVGLTMVTHELARNLPHGYQSMLGIARALAIQPQLLLLDEPLGGMNPDEIGFTLDIIRKLNSRGITIMVIEHNMKILDLCDRVTVINFGNKIVDGTCEEIRCHPEVMKAYLGSEDAA
jgi:branched-chain amino acid transport system ATP-binding protein